eukprot:TRINITY_DN256_c0_g1_i1.p1 TRINITY_DN256_c0_g1~~TRINITY_DN256_c0_g1_i1.p1  ORF type:complete len:340 (-),score=197.35 TRINITY_DN256_c0_g1_i1:43-1062(-)
MAIDAAQLEQAFKLALAVSGKDEALASTEAKDTISKADALSLSGSTKEDSVKVQKVIQTVSGKNFIPAIDKLLKEQIYLADTLAPTFADALTFVRVYETIKSSDSAARSALPNLTRWFDLFQHQPNVSLHFPLVEISLSFEPPKAEESKKGGSSSSSSSSAGGKKGGAAAAVAKADPLISQINIQVGKIVSCENHPNADKLYVEKIDLGEESGPRVVVSGLRQFATLEEMQNRLVLVVTNLKPTPLVGIESFGLVLCASNADHSDVEILSPPEGAQIGERVTFEGHAGEPVAQYNPKNWHKAKKELKSEADGTVTFKGVPFTTSKGPVRAVRLLNSEVA